METPASTPPLDLEAILSGSVGHSARLVHEHVNPAFAKVLRILGYDIHYTRGQGQYLWDDQGHRYLDCLAGFGTFACGRNHPVIRDALRQAMDRDLPNLPKLGFPRLSGLLAGQLLELAPGELDTVYFCNSGAESVESAIKYARAATGRDRVIYCKKGYHGLTMGALSVMGADEFRDGFGTLLMHTEAVPFNDLSAIETALSGRNVAAFIVEPIQGKGVNVPDDDYLPRAAALCRKYGALFIADEVQTGFGRTGKMFACEHSGVEPDILCCAKALSGGYVPVAAVLCKRWIHEKVFSSLDRCVVHSTTFGQNDLSMVAGLATLHVLREERIVENAATMGDAILERLQALVGRYEMLKDVRGRGLMIGIEFGPPRSLSLKAGWHLLHKVDSGLFPQAVLVPLLRDHRVLAQVAGHHMDVIKLLPTLVINQEDVDHIVNALEATIAACHRFPGPVWEIGRRLTSQMLSSRKDNGQPVEIAARGA